MSTIIPSVDSSVAGGGLNGPGAAGGDGYWEVVSVIQAFPQPTIGVPELSDLLGVKPTTLNARFRRENIAVSTVGRTNYIPCQLALALAERHKYALFGWPTLQEASQTTKVKAATIKARCEKGLLEGHLDLTKRLRVNPEALQSLQLRHGGPAPGPESAQRTELRPAGKAPAALGSDVGARPVKPVLATGGEPFTPRKSASAVNLPAFPSPGLSSLPVPGVRLVTARDYGMPEATRPPSRRPVPPSPLAPKAPPRPPVGALQYDPDRPFSVADCVPGKSIVYGAHVGQILEVIEDPFSPRIKASFPTHEMPVMREVLLLVGRRR